MKCKCKDCDKRFVGCHASCEDYKAFKEAKTKEYQEEYRERLVTLQLVELRNSRNKPLFLVR